MSQLEQLFATRCPSGWRVARIGIVSVMTRAEGTWIVRIGGMQWADNAANEAQAMQRAAQMVAEQLRAPTMELIKLKKLGEI
jgi:hypothetical protein